MKYYDKTVVRKMKDVDLIEAYRAVKQQSEEALDVLQWSDCCEESSIYNSIYRNSQKYLKIIENELSYRRIEI